MKLIEKVKANKKTAIAIFAGVLVLVLLIVGAVKGNLDSRGKEDDNASSLTSDDNTVVTTMSNDSLLLQMQPELTKTYGVVQDGYIWNVDGTIMSLGDKSMSAEWYKVFGLFGSSEVLPRESCSRYLFRVFQHS